MKRVLLLFLAVSLVSTVGLTRVIADDTKSQVFDYRSAVIGDLQDIGKKFQDLAKLMPPEKFTWRPAEGSRSVSELYLYVATQYYRQPYEFGAIRAAGYEVEGDDATSGRGNVTPLEKTTTDKGQVLIELNDSLSYFKGIMPTLSDTDMQKRVKIAGKDVTVYEALLMMDAQLRQRLGQAVAYARMNGVTPPWTDEEPPASR
jgi:hypothetical protein